MGIWIKQWGSSMPLLPESCWGAQVGRQSCHSGFSPDTALVPALGREIAWESKTGARSWAQLYKSKHRLGEVFQVNDCCVPLKLRAKWQERKMQAYRVPFLCKVLCSDKSHSIISIKYLLYFQGIHLPKSSKENKTKPFFQHPFRREGKLTVKSDQFNQLGSLLWIVRCLNRRTVIYLLFQFLLLEKISFPQVTVSWN